MVVAELTIAVDNCDPTRPLIPGQLISGRVICHTEHPKDFELLTLTFSGFAHVHWSESRSSGSGDDYETYTVYFTSHKDYFDFSILLDGGDHGSHELPAGGKSYPFQVIFPGNIPMLPSSFEGSVAHVRYQLFANMKRGLFKSDSKATQLFGFCAPFDLNALTDTRLIRRSVVLQNEKTVECCCFTSGPISCKIVVPKQGFVPGEHLRFRGQFFNRSKSAIRNVIVKLILKAEYRAEGSSEYDSYVMATIQSTPIEPGKDFYSEGPLMIPVCPPTNLGANCGIINVHYVLEFIMIPDNAFSKNLTVQMPIVIGTVPLR